MIEIQTHKIFRLAVNCLFKRYLWLILVFGAVFFSFSSSAYTVNLYGHTVNFSFQKQALSLSSPLSTEMLTSAVKANSDEEVNHLLMQLDSISVCFGLDDIAYLLFLEKVSKSVYSDFFESNVFKYTLLKQKGYRTMLGYSTDYITVYGQLDFKVHNVAFVEYNHLVYTDVSFKQNLEPCHEQLFEAPIAGRAITMNESRPPFFNAESSTYKIHFEYEGMNYHFQGNLNKSLLAYYKELPAIEFGQVYLNYQLSKQAKESLISSLKESTRNMFPSKQIDFLLQFAQTAFVYKKDYEWMGVEKFAFPEEVLANQFADCEDKSVLFAYLAKEVLDLPSVALIYYVDNHLNVGVAFNHKSAYNFIYNNQKYLVCEPSGFGFKPGDNVYDLKKASIVKW